MVRDNIAVRFALSAAPFLSALLPSCVSSGDPLPEMATQINATLDAGPSVLAPGDEIEVRFPRQADWNHTTRVRGDGKASFLFLGDRPVAGRTTEAVGRDLAQAYGPHLQNPEPAVFLRVPAPRSVIVMGDVRRPGEIAIGDGRLSLLDAIGRAGGPMKETAHLESTLLVRWIASEGRQAWWKIDASRDHWDGPTPVLLQAHDIVFVPNTGIDRVNLFIEAYINRMIPSPGFFRTSGVAAVP